MSTNRRYLPTPPTKPSAKAARLLRAIEEIADGEPGAQKAIDLMHIHRAAYERVDPALYEAVREHRLVTFDGMAELAGMSRAGVQIRVDNGDPSKVSRVEARREQMRRAEQRQREKAAARIEQEATEEQTP